MLFFHKLLPVFLLPIGVVIVLVLLGLRQKWRWLGLVGAAGLYVASLPVVGGWLLGRLEGAYPRLKVAEAPAADVVLVLGGTMGPPVGDGYVPNWAESMERFEGGVALVQAGKAGRLLFTGAPRSSDGRFESEGAAMLRLAVARGVPREQTDVTGPVANTADEVEALRRYCQERGYRRVLLVTSAWHMPRSMRLFRKAGVEITPFPVDFRYAPLADQSLRYMAFMPHAVQGLGQTELALRECYGIAFYAMLGR